VDKVVAMFQVVETSVVGVQFVPGVTAIAELLVMLPPAVVGGEHYVGSGSCPLTLIMRDASVATLMKLGTNIHGINTIAQTVSKIRGRRLR